MSEKLPLALVSSIASMTTVEVPAPGMGDAVQVAVAVESFKSSSALVATVGVLLPTPALATVMLIWRCVGPSEPSKW